MNAIYKIEIIMIARMRRRRRSGGRRRHATKEIKNIEDKCYDIHFLLSVLLMYVRSSNSFINVLKSQSTYLQLERVYNNNSSKKKPSIKMLVSLLFRKDR
jgi:hypothetical protein